jgi:hypothetical protein
MIESNWRRCSTGDTVVGLLLDVVCMPGRLALDSGSKAAAARLRASGGGSWRHSLYGGDDGRGNSGYRSMAAILARRPSLLGRVGLPIDLITSTYVVVYYNLMIYSAKYYLTYY